MKVFFNKFCFFILCFMFFSFFSCFAENVEKISVYPYEDSEVLIYTCEIDGEEYLFLPSNADVEALRLSLPEGLEKIVLGQGENSVSVCDGEKVNLKTLSSYSFPVVINISAGDKSYDLNVYLSSNVGTVYLISDDAENKGREWVEASEDKSNKAKGTMLFKNADGKEVYKGRLTQIKGRGNITWLGAKKPYQIKLETKTDLLCSENENNAAKTWVLLASYYDITMMRNSVALDMALEMGMENTAESEQVDLYYDGMYRGTYQLCEKVELGEGRVDIFDLDEENQNQNPDIDLADLEVKSHKTENGATYTYVDTMKENPDVTGGYLLEMDYKSQAEKEICYFATKRGNYVVVKSPEFASQKQMEYIASLYQDYEDAVFNQGINPRNGKKLEEYIDLVSLARCYLINEWTKNPDGLRSSSYLYKERGEDLLVCGPVWDYDLAFGVARIKEHEPGKEPEGWYTIISDLGRSLYNYEPFRQAVNNEFYNNMLPLINKVLINTSGDSKTDTKRLKSFEYYKSEIELSVKSNYTLWDFDPLSDCGEGLTEGNYNYLYDFIVKRSKWLEENISYLFTGEIKELNCFVDVPSSAWFAQAVKTAAHKGIVSGYGNNAFFPYDNLTKAQVLQILYNHATPGEESQVLYEIDFSDVSENDWFYEAVSWATEKAIFSPDDSGYVYPEEQLTRQEVLLLLYRYAENPICENHDITGFSDWQQVSEKYYDAICWAAQAGIIKGYEDATLRPENKITRAQFCIMFLAFEEYVGNQ